MYRESFGVCRFFFNERACVLCPEKFCVVAAVTLTCCLVRLIKYLKFASIVLFSIVFDTLSLNETTFWLPCVPFRILIIVPFEKIEYTL